MELVGAQSWASKTRRSSPILRFLLDLFEIWATPFESIDYLEQNKKKIKIQVVLTEEMHVHSERSNSGPIFGSVLLMFQILTARKSWIIPKLAQSLILSPI